MPLSDAVELVHWHQPGRRVHPSCQECLIRDGVSCLGVATRAARTEPRPASDLLSRFGAMSVFVGMDGCRDRWVCIARDASTGRIEACILSRVEDLLRI